VLRRSPAAQGRQVHVIQAGERHLGGQVVRIEVREATGAGRYSHVYHSRHTVGFERGYQFRETACRVTDCVYLQSPAAILRNSTTILAGNKPVAYLTVRVTPSAARDSIDGWYGHALRVRVSAPAEKGKANAALIRLLAERLEIETRRIRIVRGVSTRNKLVEIEGLDDIADIFPPG